MRIIVAGPAASIHVDRWVRHLARRGHAVSVFSDLAPTQLPPSVSVRISSGAWLPKPARFLLGALQLWWQVRRERPDVVHLHSVGATALLARAVPSGRLVISPWGSEVAAAMRNGLRRRIVKHALRRAALVLTTSRSMAADVVSAFKVAPERVAVISWGVDTELFRPAEHDERRRRRAAFGLPDGIVVTAIRTTQETYRTREVIRAFMDAGRDDMHLVVIAGFTVGDRAKAATQATYRQEVGGLARAVGAGRCTIIDRQLAQSDYAELLSSSDGAVSIPAADQRSSSVLEALAVGATVVGSAIDPYRELQADGFAIDLIPEPVERSLTDWLRRMEPISEERRAANIKLISLNESRDEQYRKIESRLQQLADSR
jgi:glycosyltransferase involved in cell wall biosynthesis